jgi:hypothetical protein
MEVSLPQSKAKRRPRQVPATYDDLFRRLTTLADDATRLGYPFTAEHLTHLAWFVIKDEGMASAGIAGNVAEGASQAGF